MNTNDNITTNYGRLSKIIVLSLVIWITSSCKYDKEETIIISPLNAFEREVSLSEFTNDITYIPLDNQVLFQHLNRIEITKNGFMIRVHPNGILSFDRAGNLLNNIGSRGRGPGEYFAGLDFAIDQEGELIYILDTTTEKIIIYTFNGEFVRQFSIHEFEENFWDIIFIDGKLYLAGVINSGYAKYNWLIIDTLGNLYSNKINPISPFESTFGGSGGFFCTMDEGLFYWGDYNDTIFIIQDSLYQPAMFFSPGDVRQPYTYNSKDDFGKYFIPRTLIGTSNYLFHSYYLNQLLYSTYIDRRDGKMVIIGNSNKVSIFDLPGLPNDIDGGPAFPPFFYFHENNEEFLIGWIYAYRLKSHVESDAFKTSTPKFPEKKKQLEKLATSLDENDNPVLMLVKLKE